MKVTAVPAVAFALVLTGACRPSSEAKAPALLEAAPGAVHFEPGPLRIEPAPPRIPSALGTGARLAQLKDGFSVDSNQYLSCAYSAEDGRTACAILDFRDHSRRWVMGANDPMVDDGPDPALELQFQMRGIPAPEGSWRYAGDLELHWHHGAVVEGLPREVSVSLFERSAGVDVPITTFKVDDGAVYLRSAEVSPDGRRLAIVGVHVPGVTPQLRILNVDQIAAETFRAASKAVAERDRATASVLLAKAEEAERQAATF
jgi:hypothetical protein